MSDQQSTAQQSDPAGVYEEFTRLAAHLNSLIIGQPDLNRRLLIALLADGHLLVEGAPGLAKTTAIKTLANAVEGEFHRVQFTPDLLPADLTGTEIYRPQTTDFEFQPGPIFHNVLLADEINRAPAKVQSALLESMAERQVTVGRTSYPLPELFLVMATQNPIEQEGTYPLPEAQLDRFLMYTKVGYPNWSDEKKILHLVRDQTRLRQSPDNGTNTFAVGQAEVFAARRECLDLFLSPRLEDYLVEFVTATREPERYAPELSHHVLYGASPRGTLALDACARAHAWLDGRDYVGPGDIHEVVSDVLRHRLVLTYEAEADGVTPDDIIGELLGRVPVP